MIKKSSLAHTLIISVMVIFISGCQSVGGMADGDSPHDKTTRCSKADVLLSNLSQPTEKRIYSLKPGVPCDA